MNIYLVRHGETDANISGKYCGVTDTALTETGKIQTEVAARYLKGIRAAAVYSSPLLRTRALAELLHKQAVYDSRIAERNFGVWEGKTYAEICTEYPEEERMWREDWVNYKIPGGESCDDTQKRSVEFLEYIKAKNEDCIVITHSGIIRCIITELLGIGVEKLWHFKIDNGSVTHIKIEDGYAIICGLNIIP